ncbi:MAG: ABC transporter permease [Bacteroidales bacterium]
MKTIIRNFLSVLRRFRLAMVLNILGLSIAFVAFMLIMMQLRYDREYDTCHRDVNALYRFDFSHDGSNYQAIICRPLTRMFAASSPHIVEAGITGGFRRLFFFVDRNGSRNGHKESNIEVSPEIPHMFGFDMVEGDINALEEPSRVLLPLSMAKKFFGNESAVGKQLTFDDPDATPLIVGGVFRDLPDNSSMRNVIYQAIDPQINYDIWGNWNYNFYVRLDDPANKQLVIDNFRNNYGKLSEGINYAPGEMYFTLTPLPALHYLKNVSVDNVPKASMETLYVLAAIAFVILLIAGINFTNFSVALTPVRVKSINTQKVLGSSDAVLRISLIVEAVIISFTAYLMSLGMLYMIGETSLSSVVEADISMMEQFPILLITAGVALLLGLIAGLYPAYYITSFPPALVLKGSFGLSPKGKRMRTGLIGIQYMASFALIIGALFLYLQNQYMQRAPLGYDRDQLIITDMNLNMNKNREALSQEITSFTGIGGVSFSSQVLSSSDSYMSWGRQYKDKEISFQCLPVSSTFLDVMGIKTIDGRGFRPEDDLKEHGVLVFNQTARALYNLELDTEIDGMPIIGFIEDVKFASFRKEISPMVFMVWGKYSWGNREVNYSTAYIKVNAGADMRGALNHVKKSLTKFDSEYPFDVRMYDQVMQQTYEKELQLSTQITLFSLIAIFICIVGVFGLVVFDSEYRRKEISLRKVMGATVENILIMFNRSYLILMVVCFFVAIPFAYIAVVRWLENFAYRTPIYWWVFAIAFVAVGVITILTVTFQNWRVANENPVKNIKSE